MKSISFLGIGVIATGVLAITEQPLTIEVRVLFCLLIGLIGGLLSSAKNRRVGKLRLVTDAGNAGFLGALIGLLSHHWAKDSVEIGLAVIALAGFIGWSGREGWERLKSVVWGVIEQGAKNVTNSKK